MVGALEDGGAVERGAFVQLGGLTAGRSQSFFEFYAGDLEYVGTTAGSSVQTNLLAYTAFPTRGGKAQVDLVAVDMGAIRRIARRNGWRLSDAKKGFLVQGDDRVGAVHNHLKKLAHQKINITATDAVSAGQGRYAMLLWVKPKDYARAAKALGAR